MTSDPTTVYRPIIFKDYCLLERVSVGGMAEVFRARRFNETNLRRFLAVKRILPNLAEDTEFITMFIDEAKVSIQLNHPNVCQMYELGRLNDSYYIVMEFISGRDLLAIQNRFRKQKRIMSVSQAVYIVSEICEGLDYAHRKVDDDGRPLSIIHRDISPQNVIVGYDGLVKVIDFGIARAATKNQQTQVGVLKGKFGYMSPEQVAAGPIDHRSDIFAVGTLFWELLTARRLFHAETDFATLEKVRHARVQPPSRKNPHVPEEIDRIVLRALARKPEERYQSAGELGADLRAFLAAVKPPYTRDTLSNWMVNAFKEHVQEERHKIGEFDQFVTADDVRRYNDEQLSNAAGEVFDLEELGAEIEEATRVYDPAMGAAGEIFAAGTAVETIGDTPASFGAIDTSGPSTAPGHQNATTGRRQLAVPRKSRAGLTAALVGSAVLVLALLAVVVVLLLPPKTGVLEIDLTPAEGVVVLVDGVAVSGPGGALRIEGLAPGVRTLEVQHPEHESLFEEITVEPGAVLTLQRALVPLRGGEGTLHIVLDDAEGAEVYIDGQATRPERDGRTLSLTVPAGEPLVVEVVRPGHYAEELSLEVRRNDELRREVALRPVQGTLIIGSTPAGTVYLNGEQRGVTSPRLHLTGLDPHVAHDLEIRPRSRGFRPYRQTIVFDTIPDLRIHPRLRRIGEADDAPAAAHGLLAVAPHEGRFFRILVDGRDLGVGTPLATDDAVALRAGEREIVFVRGADRRSLNATIVEGETLELRVPDAE